VPTIFLVRHGETDWNREGRIMGALPVPLNERGDEQARSVAHALTRYPIAALFSSPIARAVQTARRVAERLGLPITEEAGLTELAMGGWEGRYWNELESDASRRSLYSHPLEARAPGGETLAEVQKRAVAAIENALVIQNHRPSVFVTHADVVRTVVAHYLNLRITDSQRLRIDHASLTIIEVTPTKPHLVMFNYVHWQDNHPLD
jgi:broad specificity phosphatase PhoE